MRLKTTVIGILVVLFAPAPLLAGDFYGLGLYYGGAIPEGYPLWHHSDGKGWRYFSVCPSCGWYLTERMSVKIEGELGLYDYHETDQEWLVGGSVVGAYDILKAPGRSLFFEGGGGPNFLDGDLVWSVKAGAGVAVKDLRISYRFMHHSKLGYDDGGYNSHGIFVEWRF